MIRKKATLAKKMARDERKQKRSLSTRRTTKATISPRSSISAPATDRPKQHNSILPVVRARGSRTTSVALDPEPVLDVHDIQGNIIAGFNKDIQVLAAFKIRNRAAAKRWLRRITPEINNASELLQFNAVFRQRRMRLGKDPEGLTATWVNIAFSFAGLKALTSEAAVEKIEDDAFKIGLSGGRAALLNDPPAAGETDPTAHWVIGGVKNTPDIFMIIASDTQNALDETLARVLPGAGDGLETPVVIWSEKGETRSDLPGHEHFGFKDGVSQPGVRGRASERVDDFVTQRYLDPSDPQSNNVGRPGQPLIQPGVFLLGCQSQNDKTGQPEEAVVPQPAWLKNGSFLVFRRLNQDVSGFRDFVRDATAKLAATPAFPGITETRLAALLVGRWPSGAPLARSPLADSRALGNDNNSNNDFQYAQDSAPVRLKPESMPVSAPRAQRDIDGLITPHAAHIRKVNPRNVTTTDLGNQFDTMRRRILRRGIPFGPPFDSPIGGKGAERGLHFLCYQASIVEQFEKLQQDWANSHSNPEPGVGGHDLIIGQVDGGTRSADLLTPDANGQETILAPLKQWVTPTGGGYFFAPSISALKHVLSAEDSS